MKIKRREQYVAWSTCSQYTKRDKRGGKGKEGKKQSAHIDRGRFAPDNEKYVVLKNSTLTAPSARYVAGRRRTSKGERNKHISRTSTSDDTQHAKIKAKYDILLI